MSNFENDYNKGKMAIDLLTRYLTKKGYKYREANELEQKDEIDLVINGVSVEVKLMSFPYSLCIEETGSNATNGWIYTSKARKICFVNVNNNKIYIVNTLELRNLYNKIGKFYKICYNNLSIGLYRDEWTSSFRVLPLDLIKKNIRVKEAVV